VVIHLLFRRGQRLPAADAAFVGLGNRLTRLIPRIGHDRQGRPAAQRDALFDNVDRVENDYHRFRNRTGAPG
jgi:hypothetical protein